MDWDTRRVLFCYNFPFERRKPRITRNTRINQGLLIRDFCVIRGSYFPGCLTSARGDGYAENENP